MLINRTVAAIAVALGLLAINSFADDTAAPVESAESAASFEGLTPEARQAADELIAMLPEDSEARAMLNSILQGRTLSEPGGWFQIAVPQSRFGWDYVAATYDTDGDAAVSGREFGGDQADFERLDRNHDRQVTAEDFDFDRRSGTKTPGRMLFNMIDRDADGKLTPEELTRWFESRDTDGHGFLALDDVRDELTPEEPDADAPRPEHPSVSTLVLSLRNQEMGALQPGPNLNDIAPDFTLHTLDGEPVTLSEQVGDQPVVLIFGNFTCTPFRQHSGDIEKLYERYQDRARFFLVHVREAHPEDGWYSQNNHRVGIEISQPRNDLERLEVAQACQQHLDFSLPFLVDTTDDVVGTTYSGMPNRLYLIDHEGRIAFKSGRGPFWFYPRQLEQALVLLLAEQTRVSDN